ncbi:hypothetical protein M9Y10_005232 [Tritrichomonas musculus]|uniref:Lipoyl-binding domain-containing protein n=1 Tax=Tritrichomonas musculus TaxID=1915356 RepID=A0ABR2JL87_9EUKA
MLTLSSHSYRSFAKWFTPTHEWIDIQGKIGTIGITNFQSYHLGDITHAEIHLNKEVKAGDEIGDIESVKTTNPVFSPMDGKIIEINPLILKNPKIINQSAERKGWLCKMELSDASKTSGLMDNQKYRDSIKV